MIHEIDDIQKHADFLKEEISHTIGLKLEKILGLVKAMNAKAFEIDGENDDTGLYHASYLAEDLLREVTRNSLKNSINYALDSLVQRAKYQLDKSA